MVKVFLDFQTPNGTTWFYLSFLLMIAVYFRFTRVFSLRNWDLISLFLFVPGLLAINYVDTRMLQMGSPDSVEMRFSAEEIRRILVPGYSFLFAVTGYFLLRCLLDLFLQRRPRLGFNMNLPGLAFIGVSLLGFLMYEVMAKPPNPSGRTSSQVASRLIDVTDETIENDPPNPVTELTRTSLQSVHRVVQNELQKKTAMPDEPVVVSSDIEIAVARSAAVLCNLLILVALVLIGWRHFDSPDAGVGMATLYLLLPSTAVNIEKIDHLFPAVFLAWAVFCYRRPIIVGVLFGLAGMFSYPLFLLPLWCGFYWRRGAVRFVGSFILTSVVLALVAWWLDPFRSFLEVWFDSLPWNAWEFQQSPITLGFWTASTQIYRLPIFIVFAISVVVVAFWPAQKNLGELIALSVALILGVQFWYGSRGGTYIHWYLPLLLMMIFRPNLSNARPPAIGAKRTEAA